MDEARDYGPRSGWIRLDSRPACLGELHLSAVVLGDTLVMLTQPKLVVRAARWNTKPVEGSAGDSPLWYGLRAMV